MKSLSLQIASLPDREKVVAEIWLKDVQVAEVSNEDGRGLMIEIYPAPANAKSWAFEFGEFIDVLKKAAEGIG